MLFCLSYMAYAQDGADGMVRNAQVLEYLADSLERDYLKQHALSREKALHTGLKSEFITSEGVRFSLQRIEDGIPYYYRTFNRGGATTSGVQRLYPFGQLRLFLTGKTVTAGIWDGGRVFAGHPEFGGRVTLINQEREFDSHATHVAGSMVAAGLDARARGMAYEGRLRSFDWDNDLSEMASEAANGLLISNHSYGISLGWERIDGEWKWMGQAAADEDYRFGFYSNVSRVLDQITYQAPYYLVVWAAGNDRSDVGDSSRPPDGPYDSIGPEGIAKNVLTVGAVNAIQSGFSQASDIVMTDFSSWGPSDDGRIKPDLVAKGRQVYSTDLNNSHSTKSGTSMAAPIVSGSLMLIQELYHKFSGGNYLRSASLKGLAIHTANAANSFFRPDYRHGWGLLDAEKMANFLLHLHEPYVSFWEGELANKQSFEHTFYVDGQTSIMATLSWTDPPGTPVAPKLNPRDLMLVNDLDMRLVHESGKVSYPFMLDPEKPDAEAATVDNFRDNVEKIYIDEPLPGSYQLIITHKDELAGEKQEFSLFLQTGFVPTRRNLYWIGGSGNWDDEEKWSFQSGGEPAGVVPGKHDHVVLDNNSFTEPMQTLSLNKEASCYSLTISGNADGLINLGEENLSIISSLYVENPVSGPQVSGQIIINGDGKEGVVWMNREDVRKENVRNKTYDNRVESLKLVFDNQDGVWHIPESIRADQVVVRQGKVVLSDASARIRELIVEEAAEGNILDLGESYIDGLEKFAILGGDHVVSGDKATLVFNTPDAVGTILTPIYDHLNLKRIENHMSLHIHGALNTKSFITNGDVFLHNTLDADSLFFTEKAGFYFFDQATIVIHEELSGSGIPENRVDFIGHGSDNYVEGRINKIFCLDYLNIVDLPVIGAGVFNAGTNSTLENSPGWLTVACDRIVFADFSVESPCRDSRTTFRDLSRGEINSWNWQFNDLGTSAIREPAFTFTQTGDYNIQLTVSSDDLASTSEKTIQIIENPLPVANILRSGNIYFVDVAARSYQWYRNGREISGAVSQSYNNTAMVDGVYTVVISNNGVCNRIARNQIVVNVPDEPDISKAVRVFPNPARLSAQIVSDLVVNTISVYNLLGVKVYGSSPESTSFELNLSGFTPGIYLLYIEGEFGTYSGKLHVTN